MNKIAVVGTPGGQSSELLADAVARRTGQRILIDMADVELDLESGGAVCGALDLTSLDGVIVKKISSAYSPHSMDRLEMLRYLYRSGVPVFSHPCAIARVVNRLSGTTALRLAQIPMPPTVVTENLSGALAAIERFGACVFKPLFTSKARGMAVIRPGEDAEDTIRAFMSAGNQVMYIQKLLDLSGRDLGLAFLGGEYVGAYARLAGDKSWSTVTNTGGRYAKAAPSPEVIEMARRAQSVFGLDFAVVDVAYSANGPVVFEVSAFGGFRGLREACGLDAADMYVEYVLSKLRSAS